jgi:sulfite reductase (NADPH) flavoprotein alpha-component
MIRKLHRWPALLAAVLLIVLALSGSVLSVFPAMERIAAPTAASDQTVAQLAALVAAEHPGVEQIKRSPSGKITVWWFVGNTPGAAIVDPATGKDIGSADPSMVEQWFISLHRSIFFG